MSSGDQDTPPSDAATTSTSDTPATTTEPCKCWSRYPRSNVLSYHPLPPYKVRTTRYCSRWLQLNVLAYTDPIPRLSPFCCYPCPFTYLSAAPSISIPLLYMYSPITYPLFVAANAPPPSALALPACPAALLQLSRQQPSCPFPPHPIPTAVTLSILAWEYIDVSDLLPEQLRVNTPGTFSCSGCGLRAFLGHTAQEKNVIYLTLPYFPPIP